MYSFSFGKKLSLQKVDNKKLLLLIHSYYIYNNTILILIMQTIIEEMKFQGHCFAILIGFILINYFIYLQVFKEDITRMPCKL